MNVYKCTANFFPKYHKYIGIRYCKISIILVHLYSVLCCVCVGTCVCWCLCVCWCVRKLENSEYVRKGEIDIHSDIA